MSCSPPRNNCPDMDDEETSPKKKSRTNAETGYYGERPSDPTDKDGEKVRSGGDEEANVLDLRPDSDNDDDDAYEFLPDDDDPPIGTAEKECNFILKNSSTFAL